MIKKINLTNENDLFNNNGFIIFDKFLLEENIEILKNRFDDLFDGKFENTIEPDEWNWKKNLSDPSATRQICNVWKSDNLIRKIVCNETIGLIASKLMGWQGARLVQDNILWKPSGGKNTWISSRCFLCRLDCSPNNDHLLDVSRSNQSKNRHT